MSDPILTPAMVAYNKACADFVLTLASPALTDRDAAWAGMEAILAGFTAGVIDGPSAQAASKRLKKVAA